MHAFVDFAGLGYLIGLGTASFLGMFAALIATAFGASWKVVLAIVVVALIGGFWLGGNMERN